MPPTSRAVPLTSTGPATKASATPTSAFLSESDPVITPTTNAVVTTASTRSTGPHEETSGWSAAGDGGTAALSAPSTGRVTSSFIDGSSLVHGASSRRLTRPRPTSSTSMVLVSLSSGSSGARSAVTDLGMVIDI